MTNPSTVFDHPEMRSRVANPEVADRISLRDHIVSVEIGAFEVERDVTQRLAFNVVVEVAPPGGPLDDNVDLILSYDSLTDAIAIELAAERVNLLETLADRIAARILCEPAAQRVYLRIEKLDRGAGKLGVEIMRETRLEEKSHDTKATHDIIVGVLPDGGDVVAWATWAQALDQRMVLVSGGGVERVPPIKGPRDVARRVGLLAMDQQAWIASAEVATVSVVATLTEMMWGLAQGQVNFWAPNRLVLSHVDAPTSNDPEQLAAWLADHIGGTSRVLAAKPPQKDPK